MDEYTEVLTEWAAEHVGKPIEEIERVEIAYEEGYHYSSYTFEDPYFIVRIHLTDGSYRIGDYENMGELLTRLLSIASKRDA